MLIIIVMAAAAETVQLGNSSAKHSGPIHFAWHSSHWVFMQLFAAIESSTLNVRRSTFLLLTLMSLDTPSTLKINAEGYRVGIVAARYNSVLVDSLILHADAEILKAGGLAPVIEHVPGSAELPLAAAMMAKHSVFDAIIVIGVVIAGDTNHHNIIGESTAIALQNLNIELQTPIINGILVVENLSQAEARAGDTINRGKEFAHAALEMAQFITKWKIKKNP